MASGERCSTPVYSGGRQVHGPTVSFTPVIMGELITDRQGRPLQDRRRVGTGYVFESRHWHCLDRCLYSAISLLGPPITFAMTAMVLADKLLAAWGIVSLMLWSYCIRFPALAKENDVCARIKARPTASLYFEVPFSLHEIEIRITGTSTHQGFRQLSIVLFTPICEANS